MSSCWDHTFSGASPSVSVVVWLTENSGVRLESLRRSSGVSVVVVQRWFAQCDSVVGP